MNPNRVVIYMLFLLILLFELVLRARHFLVIVGNKWPSIVTGDKTCHGLVACALITKQLNFFRQYTSLSTVQ